MPRRNARANGSALRAFASSSVRPLRAGTCGASRGQDDPPRRLHERGNVLRQETIKRPRVGLFVTCLVDLFRPTVGFASVKLLEEAGCEVEVPMAQTCCGQPAYNSGDRADTIAIAKNTIKVFEEYDYVVAPSGSCAGMLKKHYPALFAGEAGWEERATAF